MPRQAPPNIETLRAALTLRATQWKAELRAEPKVARLLLRRLVGPMTLWDEADAGLRWDAETKPHELLEGLVQLGTSPAGSSKLDPVHLVASPTGVEDFYTLVGSAVRAA